MIVVWTLIGGGEIYAPNVDMPLDVYDVERDGQRPCESQRADAGLLSTLRYIVLDLALRDVEYEHVQRDDRRGQRNICHGVAKVISLRRVRRLSARRTERSIRTAHEATAGFAGAATLNAVLHVRNVTFIDYMNVGGPVFIASDDVNVGFGKDCQRPAAF